MSQNARRSAKVLEAAEALGNEKLIKQIKDLVVKIAQAAAEGLNDDGSMNYEYEPTGRNLIKQREWWVQAETVIGFFNAWQISGDEKYLTISINNWNLVKNKILDKTNGEWFWGIKEDGQIMEGEDKVGLWKCPYHNSRACTEIIKRTGN